MERGSVGGMYSPRRRDCPGGVVSGRVPEHGLEPEGQRAIARAGASASARVQPAAANPPPADLNPSSCLRSTPKQRFFPPKRCDAMQCGAIRREDILQMRKESLQRAREPEVACGMPKISCRCVKRAFREPESQRSRAERSELDAVRK